MTEKHLVFLAASVYFFSFGVFHAVCGTDEEAIDSNQIAAGLYMAFLLV